MRKENVFQIVKSVCASVAFALAFALLFSLLIQIARLPSQVIKPTNQVFKVLAVAFGGLIFIRGEGGLLKGALHGTIAVIATFLVFSAISCSFSLDWFFILELLIGAAAGAIAGVLAVNFKKS